MTFKRFDNTCDAILYTTLQRLIGRRSLSLSGSEYHHRMIPRLRHRPTAQETPHLPSDTFTNCLPKRFIKQRRHTILPGCFQIPNVIQPCLISSSEKSFNKKSFISGVTRAVTHCSNSSVPLPAVTTPHHQLEKRIASVRGHQHIYKDTGCHLQNSNIPRALFS